MKYFPIKLSKYLIEEFLKSILIVFVTFLAISIFTNFISEMVFFKEKKTEEFIYLIIKLTAYKTSATIIQFSVYIFLFAGILFFVKLIKNNENNVIKISGLSDLFTILIPCFISFFVGIFIILILSPISSYSLKNYENIKRSYSSNSNLITINNNGFWFLENNNKGQNIIRADKIIDNNFSKLNNISIYILDENFRFTKRIDAEKVNINYKTWYLQNVKITNSNSEINKNNDSQTNFKEFQYNSTINIADLKNYFSNAETVSFWEILNTIKELNLRGYSADELKVKFHKYISLPIYLVLMIILSTIFTLRSKKNYSNSIYIFLAIILGILIYFLNDISIAVSLTDKLPIYLAVWTPIIIISFFCLINLIKINET